MAGRDDHFKNWQDDDFKNWEHAFEELQKREIQFKAAKKFAKEHPLHKHCKKKLDEANAAYHKIVSELK
jgi:hypothetical protein